MTQGSRDELVRTIRAELVARAGGFLRNVIRASRQTCIVCSTPVDGYSRCAPCGTHWRQYGDQVADLVVPLSCAVAGRQSGLVLRQYKDNPRAKVRDDLSTIVSLTLFYGSVQHERCIESLLAMPIKRQGDGPVPSGSVWRSPPHQDCRRYAAGNIRRMSSPCVAWR